MSHFWRKFSTLCPIWISHFIAQTIHFGRLMKFILRFVKCKIKKRRKKTKIIFVKNQMKKEKDFFLSSLLIDGEKFCVCCSTKFSIVSWLMSVFFVVACIFSIHRTESRFIGISSRSCSHPFTVLSTSLLNVAMLRSKTSPSALHHQPQSYVIHRHRAVLCSHWFGWVQKFHYYRTLLDNLLHIHIIDTHKKKVVKRRAKIIMWNNRLAKEKSHCEKLQIHTHKKSQTLSHFCSLSLSWHPAKCYTHSFIYKYISMTHVLWKNKTWVLRCQIKLLIALRVETKRKLICIFSYHKNKTQDCMAMTIYIMACWKC